MLKKFTIKQTTHNIRSLIFLILGIVQSGIFFHPLLSIQVSIDIPEGPIGLSAMALEAPKAPAGGAVAIIKVPKIDVARLSLYISS
jgi:hypothetical protein